MKNPADNISSVSNRENKFSLRRRKLITLSPLLLFAGCDIAPDGKIESGLRSFQKFNDWIQEKVFDGAKLAPEYTDGELTPEDGFRVNGYDTDQPDIDLENWRLTIESPAGVLASLTLQEIQHFPKRIMNTRHCCVEGWSMIPKWGGTPLRDVLKSVGANLNMKYVSVQCGDDYYTSYDMASILHPQTLLCYEAYNKPLGLEHGAPVRIVMPVKLGYKSAKWVNSIALTNEKLGGYWEDQGYDWFAGL